METYVFEWNFFKNIGQSQSRNIAARLLDTLANNIKEKNPITTELPAKYLDFQHDFSKVKSDKLPKYNKYNMSIDFKNKKIFFIGPVYNMFKLKLQAMREYVDKMLAKSFIISFKLFIKILVMFIKKKNGRLYLYVDYYNINAIIKKNKHLMSLVYSLLNMLSKT